MTLLEAAYYRDTCVKYARHIRREPANFPHNTRMLQSDLESNCLTGSWKDSYQKTTARVNILPNSKYLVRVPIEMISVARTMVDSSRTMITEKTVGVQVL